MVVRHKRESSEKGRGKAMDEAAGTITLCFTQNLITSLQNPCVTVMNIVEWVHIILYFSEKQRGLEYAAYNDRVREYLSCRETT